MDDPPIASAVETASNVIAQAAETAKRVVDQAALTAAAVIANEGAVTKALSDALREVFGENEKAGRFVDITKIPLICKSIIDTNNQIKEIKEMFDKLDNKFVTKEQFTPIQKGFYGLVGLITGSVIISILISIGLKLK